jgi:hypothetical protein
MVHDLGILKSFLPDAMDHRKIDFLFSAKRERRCQTGEYEQTDSSHAAQDIRSEHQTQRLRVK